MGFRNVLLGLIGVVLLMFSCTSGDPGGGGGGNNGMGGSGPTNCPVGQTACGNACVDLKTNSNSCGACGAICPPGSSCVNGACTTCAAGTQLCNGTCSLVSTDVANCGSCGHVCGSNQVCNSGSCGCPGGLLGCAQACLDGMTDVNNCGTCNRRCMPGQACTGGNCQCQAGLTDCSGACVSLPSNPMHCGACGNACPAGQVCNQGTCSAMCSAGLMNCSAACISTMTDVFNCGGCGMACPAGQACTNGTCGCAVAGQTLCGGACVDTRTNTNNCGSCGVTCSGGQVCTNGVCGCPTMGQQLCGAQCTDVSNNVLNCGMCGRACGAGQMCVGGTCTCPTGQMPCNGACAPTGQCGTGGSGGGGGGGGGGSGGGGTTRPPGCPADPALLSDFEEGSAVLVPQGMRTGWWFVFADPSAGSQTPAAVADGPIAAEMLPAGEQSGACQRFALHSTSSGHPQYTGFGATFSPVRPASSMNKNPVSLASYTGISFRIKSGSGTAPPVLFEIQTRENQPAPAGVATNNAVDMYNTRGKLLTGIGTSWTEVFVNFGTLAPRYLPDAACAAGVLCEAPGFNPANALGIQFSVYDQFPPAGSYNLWVDDVKLYTGDTGLATLNQTGGMHRFPQDRAVGSCTKPAGASGKYLVDMYNRWKAAFVTSEGAGGGLRVRRPENANDTVSEGIAYGMLIAVYMNDKALFDGLWTYWSAGSRTAAAGPLMHWHMNSGGGVQETGSALDADEDAAFALLQAEKQWGGYQARAVALIQGIYASEVEPGTLALKPGNQFGGAALSNPSYFAPAYYRLFDAADPDASHNWAGVITTGYNYLNAIAGSNGLVPAWCTNGCTGRGGGPAADPEKYQYDSHRTPWRIGLDACWNNNQAARDYVLKTTNFFAGRGAAGIGTVGDIYLGDGTVLGTAKKNSMSIIGTAAVGAMVTAGSNAGHKSFLDRSFRFILDATYTPDPAAQMTAYTYYNATVGLLAALTMSGNFNNL